MTKKTLRSNPFHMRLPWIKEGDVITAPLIKMYGAKTSGKDAVTNALKKESCNADKVRNIGVWRDIRQGEDLLSNPGIDPAKLHDIVDKKVLAFYPSNGILYFVLEENVKGIIAAGQTPVLHVGSRYGVPTIEESGKLPLSLNVLLTMDTTRTDIDDDLRTRAIWRLAKYKDNPNSTWMHGADWDYNTGSLEDRAIVDRQVEKTRDNIKWLEEDSSKIISYHAIFENNAPADNDVRCYVRERIRDKDVVTQDIARRINELFRRFKKELDAGVDYNAINFMALHRGYTTDCLAAIFGEGQSLHKSSHLAYTQLGSVIEDYADGFGLTRDGLSTIVTNVHVARVQRSLTVKGRQEIYLTSADDRPLHIADIEAEHFYPKFHILGIIAEAVYRQTHTLPQYQVENGIVKGITFSLTDRSVGKNHIRPQIFIGY